MTAVEVSAILAGTAPVLIIPFRKTVGKFEVVEPVPIKPKLGSVSCAMVELFSAPRATFVTAPKEVEPVMNEPAAKPPEDMTEAIAEAVMNDPAENPLLPKNPA